MSLCRQRTTFGTYAMSTDYSKALAGAKRVHRDDKKFYMEKTWGVYASVSMALYNARTKNDEVFEEWNFIDGRWRKKIIKEI